MSGVLLQLQRVRRGWDRLSIYLPVALMFLLALGTWWLVRNAPKPPQAEPPRAPAHEVDYFMRDFSVKSFDATGRLSSEMLGDMARHYLDTDTLEVDRMRLRATTPEGRVTTASANRAVSNADGSEVQLFGNAVVIRESQPRSGQEALPRLEFRGEFLQVWVNSERVKSDLPVTLKRGDDVFTADNLDYDNLDQIVQLRGRVRGTFQPAPADR